MRRFPSSVILGLLLLGGSAPAQEATPSCFYHRPYLTGDFFGLRSALNEHKLNVDMDLTQFYQDVAAGGRNPKDAYGGKVDYFVTALEGLMVMHAETRFGEDVNLEAAGAAPVNVNMLYPTLQNSTAITGLQFNLPLSPDQDWILTAGKINTLDLLYQLYPQTGRGVDTFMNLSSSLPMTLGRTVPFSFLGTGVLKLRDKQIQGALLVYDSHNVPTTSGFETLFDNGTNFAAAWRFFTDFGGRPGSHLFLGTYATGEYTSLDPTAWSYFPEIGIVPGRQSDSWSALYILEQQLWADARNANRTIGLLSSWGLSDLQTSPYEWCCNVALQSRGLIRRRADDTSGLAYFYSGLSGNMKDLFNPLVPLHDVYGVELYYNAEITRWFHLTADFQVVEPAIVDNDAAVVFGLRAKIDL